MTRDTCADDVLDQDVALDRLADGLADALGGAVAIGRLTESPLGEGVYADQTRAGIHYIAVKLEADIRMMLRLATARTPDDEPGA